MRRHRYLLAAVSVSVLAVAACGQPAVAPALPPVAASVPAAVPDSSAPVTSVPSAPAPSAPVPSTPPTAPCVNAQELAAVPLRQQLAQLLMVGVDPSGSAQTKDVVAQGVGGIFVGGDATGLLTSGVLQQLQSTTKFGVLVAADEEGGRVQRIDELAGSVPSARDMAATMTVQQVHDLAFARGAQLRKYGITIDFAPDADVSDHLATPSSETAPSAPAPRSSPPTPMPSLAGSVRPRCCRCSSTFPGMARLAATRTRGR